MFRDQKNVVNVSLAFLRTVLWLSVTFIVFGRVFLAIANKIEVCPLFAALRVFCYALRFFPLVWPITL